MRKFFTLLTAVLATTAVWAQFDEPELKPATGVSIDGTTEYILSVKNSEGTEYFYGKGNNWGTRTSVKEAAEEALTVRFSAITQTIDEAQVECVRFNNYVSDKGGWGAYADCDGGLSAWVDGQGRTGDGLWQLKDLGNGQIELTNLNAPGGKFGVSWTVQNWSADDEDYIDGTGELDFDNRCYFIGAEVGKSYIINEEGDTTDVKDSRIYGENICTTWTLYNASLYNAQKQLYDWYWESYAEYEGNAGVDAAVAAAAKVYENANATPAELNAAYDAIIAAIDMIAVEENSALLEGASAEDPIELFEAGILQNGDFESENIEGWNANLKGNNNQYQSARYSSNGVTIQHFAESWTWNAQHSGDGEFTQKVGLPAGLYKLEADIIAVRQSADGDKKAASKGVELFAKSATEEFFIPVATNNEAPEHFVLTFKTQGGTFTVGVREIAPTVNWIAMDNFKMTYYGAPEQTIEQINLKGVIDTYTQNYENLKGEDGEIHAKNSEIDAFDKALESAIAAYESGDYTEEQFVEFGDSIKSKYSKLSSSVNDYKYFAQCIATVEARVEEFNETNPACAGEIADYLEELRTAYAEQEWVRSQMDEILPHVSEIMGKYADVQPGDDVTFYLNNAAFNKDFSGWQTTGRSPWWGANLGQGANANAELCQETPEENDGDAENYHSAFTMYQTIKNLPAGLYTLSVQGFNRKDGDGNPAELYAVFSDGTEQSVAFADINDYMTEDRLYLVVNDNGDTQWMSDASREDGAYWVPNGMSGAAWHFVNKKDGENYDYTNKFSILMKEAGDLTVGVRCDNANQWVIFDNFRLVYEGSGSMVWEATIQDEINKLDNKATEAEITDGCYLEISEVIKKAESFCKEISDKSEDECLAMLDELKAQYAVISENLDLIKQLVANYEALDAVSALAEEADAELKARYDAIWAKVDGDYFELTNAQLKEAIEEAKAVVALVKMPKGWENASDSNPVDFSAVIANRHFNSDGVETDTAYDEEPEATGNYTFTVWSGKQPSTGGGTPGNCGEVWNSSAFESYQDLIGLPAGTYVLSCQGFLRHGGGTANSYSILNGEKDQEVYAYLYAESAEGKYSKELENIASVQLTTEDCDSLGIDLSGGSSDFGGAFKGSDQLKTADQFFKAGYYNNSVTVKVGADGALRVGFKKVGAVGQDWVVVDNFSLIYLGNASTAETSGDDATAINEVALTAQKAIYTLTGVRVSKAVKPGLYIINGKKIVVK